MTVRISGINLPDQKRLEIALTYIYGIGRPLSLKILDKVGIDKNTKPHNLTGAEEKKLRDYVEREVKVEGELKRQLSMSIKHHRDIGTYRGTRHAKGLPARGQRTKTNSRTVRGNVRKTAGSGRKSTNEKT